MDTQQALTALQHCFPHLHISSIKPATQGRDNFVLEINEDLIFRFPRNKETEKQLLREVQLLCYLGSQLTPAVPYFLYNWQPDQRYPHPFVGYHKLKGSWLNDPGILPDVREKLLPPIAQFLRELHQIPLTQVQSCEVRGGAVQFWVHQYQRRFEQIQATIFPLLPHAARKKASHQWNTYLSRHADLPFTPALIHRDLWLHHLLCDPEQGILTGVIDWGEAAIGDPALDLVGFHISWGREITEKIKCLIPIERDTTFWHRLDFYLDFYFQFYPPYTEAYKAYQSQNQHALTQHLQYILKMLEN